MVGQGPLAGYKLEDARWDAKLYAPALVMLRNRPSPSPPLFSIPSSPLLSPPRPSSPLLPPIVPAPAATRPTPTRARARRSRHDAGEVWVVVRGTASVADMLTNLDTAPAPLLDGSAHGGMLRAARSVFKFVRQVPPPLPCATPNLPAPPPLLLRRPGRAAPTAASGPQRAGASEEVHLVGHSMGGAAAALAAGAGPTPPPNVTKQRYKTTLQNCPWSSRRGEPILERSPCAGAALPQNGADGRRLVPILN